MNKPLGIFCVEPAYVERFWSKVQKIDGCWEWTGSLNRSGYGAFRTKDRYVPASRYSWFLAHGAIPDEMCVCHRCDNPPCVNPAHLFLGTLADNAHDMIAKGRAKYLQNFRACQGKGMDNPQAKLDDDKIRAIRSLHIQGLGTRRLARQFNVGRTTIQRTLQGKMWSHVAD